LIAQQFGRFHRLGKTLGNLLPGALDDYAGATGRPGGSTSPIDAAIATIASAEATTRRATCRAKPCTTTAASDVNRCVIEVSDRRGCQDNPSTTTTAATTGSRSCTNPGAIATGSTSGCKGINACKNAAI
jgi:hypothetical protein